MGGGYFRREVQVQGGDWLCSIGAQVQGWREDGWAACAAGGRGGMSHGIARAGAITDPRGAE